jgi:hypothetical protein
VRANCGKQDQEFRLKRTVFLLAVSLASISGVSRANEAAIGRCRAIDDPFARLKCYDAIAVTGGVPRSTTQVANKPAAPAPVVSTPVPAAATSNFGLAPKTPDAELDRIESRIDGHFEGWRPNSSIRLANGQVWQVADDSGRHLDLHNPKVWVRRGALGSFHLEIEGTNHSPRVRRIK